MPKPRREPCETGPGIVRVRLTASDEFNAGYIARLIRDDPNIEITGEPAHFSGGRLYFTAKVDREDGAEGGGR